MNDDTALSYDGFKPLFPEGKEWFSPKEVGDIIGTSAQYVRNCVYSGDIFAHTTQDLRDGKGKNLIRIHKSAIHSYLFKSANYNTDDFVETMAEILKYKSDFERFALLNLLKKLTGETTK